MMQSTSMLAANSCVLDRWCSDRMDIHTQTIILQLFGILSGTTWLSRYQEGKTNLDLLEQEIVSGSGICWAICKSPPRHR